LERDARNVCRGLDFAAARRSDPDFTIPNAGLVRELHEAMSRIHSGFVVWFTGLSGAGKSTLAEALIPRLGAAGKKVELLDGDIVRTHLSKGLTFSREDRDINVARIAFVAHLLARNGVAVVVSAISPFRSTRDAARETIGDFIEVHVA